MGIGIFIPSVIEVKVKALYTIFFSLKGYEMKTEKCMRCFTHRKHRKHRIDDLNESKGLISFPISTHSLSISGLAQAN